MILAIDPSSTLTGYAVISDHGTVVDGGVFRPVRRDDLANVRIATMVLDASNLVMELKPDVIVIEDTSGKVGARHGGRGAGLAIHGKSVGWFIAAMERLMPGKVHPVCENVWTRRCSKDMRQRRVMDAVPNYSAKKDRGADCADAIGLGLWWFAEQKLKQVA